jgi:3-oxoacyl-[acyl-carrier-protein] synthase II
VVDPSRESAGNSRPAIAGIGLATPLGATASETWEALLAGRCISDHARVPLEFSDKRGRVVPLALKASREAIAAARWTERELGSDETALLVGTSKGPVEAWLHRACDGAELRELSPPLHMDRSPYVVGGLHPTGLCEIASELANRLGFGLGPRMTLSAACASGIQALIRAAIMVESGEARRALVVAAESSLHPLFLASFRRLGVLAPASVGCRPFDRNRAGFLMSEAAAAVCLVAGDNAASASKHRRATVVLDRFALGGDAAHLTAADPSGATLRRMIKHVIDGEHVDLIHAHGTGTIQNDPIELAAIDDLPADGAPPPILYSHKGSLGHSLGAAGLIAVAINCLAHQSGIIPGNARTENPLPTRRAILATHQLRSTITRSVAVASGFGGAMAAISLKSL